MTATNIAKFGDCIKCGRPVFAEYRPDQSPQILLQECEVDGGDCTVDILKTPFCKINSLISEGI